MYPVLFRIGGFEVTSFGAMVAIAALVGLWLFRRELRRRRLPDEAADSAIAGLLGGLAGAKLLYVFEHMAEARVWDLLTDRGGMSWFGGLAGGLGAGLLMMVVKRWPVIPVLSAATPALALGHLLGRIGCFLVGDDYGRPTSLPWGVAFPEGLPPIDVPVHPTQLYEAAFLAPVTWLLIRWRRQGVADRVVIGRYLVLTAAFRFALEFLRLNTRVLGPLTVAHLFALAAVAVGLVLAARAKGRADLNRSK
jgi:phosphatidylglycerol:prolipoprotein diacylglycerol transferase